MYKLMHKNIKTLGWSFDAKIVIMCKSYPTEECSYFFYWEMPLWVSAHFSLSVVSLRWSTCVLIGKKDKPKRSITLNLDCWHQFKLTAKIIVINCWRIPRTNLQPTYFMFPIIIAHVFFISCSEDVSSYFASFIQIHSSFKPLNEHMLTNKLYNCFFAASHVKELKSTMSNVISFVYVNNFIHKAAGNKVLCCQWLYMRQSMAVLLLSYKQIASAEGFLEAKFDLLLTLAFSQALVSE